MRSAIQSHVDLYVNSHTFSEVQRSFPYLVSKEFASGGGDVSARDKVLVALILNACQVPEFKWHIIEDKVPFEIEGTGITITPFAGTFPFRAVFRTRIFTRHT